MIHFFSRLSFLVATFLIALLFGAESLFAAHLGQAFRVGEVGQTSAIVWTRVTATKERNWDGVNMKGRARERSDEYVPLPTKVEDMEGEISGSEGSVRLSYSVNKDFSKATVTDWVKVEAKDDFTHQFRIQDLQPATRYYIKVEARPAGSEKVTASVDGTFITAATKETWQNVSFGVITGQFYDDLDHKQGFHMYPAMRKLKLDFIVPTGDTVYYDSDKPRARTVALARYHWHRMYSLPRHVEMHRFIPGYWEKDDHDTLSNDCWPTQNPKWMLPMTWEDGLRIFREQNPMGEKTHRTVRWGKGLQIWMVEGRDFRSSNKMKDGPEKLIWGKEQRDWLMRTILASDADFKVIISPTPIVGPDRTNKRDNHANEGFTYAGNFFRNWTKENGLDNLFVCCGDRHWQYMSIDPKTKLREFSCGPASDIHAGGSPKHDPEVQPFHREKGGFLTVNVFEEKQKPTIAFRFHDVHGATKYEYKQQAK